MSRTASAWWSRTTPKGTGIVDSLGGLQTSVYDDAGRLKTRAQGTALISMSYYADGQVSRIDRYVSSVLVSTSSYVYDAQGRIDQIQRVDGTGANVDLFWPCRRRPAHQPYRSGRVWSTQ